MDKESYNKEWLIRTIAEKARFSIGDIRIIWKTFEELIFDIIAEKGELIIPGLFKLYVKDVEPHDGWDAVRNKPLKIGASHRIVFKPSRRLLDLLRK